MARYALRDALLQVPGDGDDGVHDLEQAISLLDHRRYDAENEAANARLAKADIASGEREIAALVAEHRGYLRRAGELRDDVQPRIDDALCAAAALITALLKDAGRCKRRRRSFRRSFAPSPSTMDPARDWP
jgi:hypothetical protein